MRVVEMITNWPKAFDQLCYWSFHILVFIFLFEVGLFNCNPVLRGTKNKPLQDILNSGLIAADSGLQLDLEIALSGVSAKTQPLRLVQPC